MQMERVLTQTRNHALRSHLQMQRVGLHPNCPNPGLVTLDGIDRHEEADEQLKRLRPPSAPPSTPRTTPAFEFHIRHGLQNSKYGVGSCSAQAVLVSPRALDAGTQRECAARLATEQMTHTYDPPLAEGCMSAVQGARELKYVAVNDEGEFLRRTHLHGCSGTCSDSWRHDGRLACNTALRHAMGFAPALQ
jgi:hypothetical protein